MIITVKFDRYVNEENDVIIDEPKTVDFQVLERKAVHGRYWDIEVLPQTLFASNIGILYNRADPPSVSTFDGVNFQLSVDLFFDGDPSCNCTYSIPCTLIDRGVEEFNRFLAQKRAKVN